MAKTSFSNQTAGSSAEFGHTPTPPPTKSPARARRRDFSFFWPGFAAGFLLLTLLSLGGLALLAGIGPGNFSEFQSQSASWTPPPAPPTAEVVQQPAADPATNDQETPAGYTVGDPLRNITQSRVNIRRVPGYLSKPDGDVIGLLAPGDTVELLGGRATADNLTWWYIRHRAPDGRQIDGWVADATASGVQILGR